MIDQVRAARYVWLVALALGVFATVVVTTFAIALNAEAYQTQYPNKDVDYRPQRCCP